MEDVPFLDGVVDVKRAEESVRRSPVRLSLKGHRGFTPKDFIHYRIVMAMLMKRSFDQDAHPGSSISRLINTWAFRKAHVETWDFNHVGSL